MLNPGEILICEKLGKIWNMFLKMERMHPDEIDDFKFHIHALQQLIMARSAQRDHPDFFLQKSAGQPIPCPPRCQEKSPHYHELKNGVDHIYPK